MLRTKSNSSLIDAIEELEFSLDSPIVPGEMVAWAHSVRDSLTALVPVLNDHVRRVHHQTIKQIAIEDPELTVQAVNLKKTDEQNLRLLESLLARCSDIPERISEVEPDEGQMDSEVFTVIDDGLRLVLAVRGQEVAINTWMNESVYRDSGSVD